MFGVRDGANADELEQEREALRDAYRKGCRDTDAAWNAAVEFVLCGIRDTSPDDAPRLRDAIWSVVEAKQG